MIPAKTAKILACALAGVTLGGALVYYNFFDKDDSVGTNIGDLCPDFSVSTYLATESGFSTGGKTFTLSKEKGKVVVVNFWSTTCAPCKAELPEFNEFQEKYADSVTIIALDGEISYTEEGLMRWLNTNSEPVDKGWKNFSLLFGKYDENENDIYAALGFTSYALPGTMIIDSEGKIVYRTDGKMSYEALEAQVLPLL